MITLIGFLEETIKCARILEANEGREERVKLKAKDSQNTAA